MNSKMFVDSERGTKAAWKGFESQTLYIANRLMLLVDDSEFYPERVEDLLVVENDIPTEAVQVKNIRSNLVLSDFSPQKQDSYFRRTLSLRQENEDLRAVIVSFGSLGNELIDLKNQDEEAIRGVSKKLLEYGYSQDEVDWLLDHLEIQVVDRDQLESQIYAELNKLTETMAFPGIAFAVLTYYISTLSHMKGKTSKVEWNLKLHHIAVDFAAMSGFQQEYGRSLRPLFEYKTNQALEKLTEEYKMGVNAHPDHIRNNLDFRREKWIERIEKGLNEYQAVVIRGASGQGKSSLAYRYLLDAFPESHVFCVEQIESGTQAANIVAALSNLSIVRENNLVVYIDVAPYQTGWLWVIQQLQKTGRKIQLLVTIREEDYRRAVVDKSGVSFDEIEVVFDKSEAEAIYEKYGSLKFRNFEEAWQMFGEAGPLMEFIYLITEVETLKQRLESQINKIRMEEAEAQSWLSVLRLSAYAGRLNINLNLRKTLEVIECKQYEKMIYLFEKEYLLRETEDKTYIEPLHAIRAEIIYSLLEDSVLHPVDELLRSAIKCIDDHSQMLIVNHCYDNDCSLALIEKISMISFDKWGNYASAIRGILWAEVFSLFRKNRNIVAEGDSYFNNAFGFLALTDITGLLGEFSLDSIFEVMERTNPQSVLIFKTVAEKIPQRLLDFGYLDTFLNQYAENAPKYLPKNDVEISCLGYVVFWLSIRGVFIPPLFSSAEFSQILESTDIEASLDLIEGAYHQNWSDQYHHALPILSKKVCSNWKIVHLEEESKDTVTTHFIADIFDSGGEPKHTSVHSQTMSVIKALRKLYPGKLRYATKILGADVLEGIPIIDGEKNVDSKYLKNEWITQLNSWFHNLNTYGYRSHTWNEYIENILAVRTLVTDSAQAILEGIDYLYKKNGNLRKLTEDGTADLLSKTIQELSKDNSLLPRFIIDRFGFVSDSTKANEEKTSKGSGEYAKRHDIVQVGGEKTIVQALQFREAFKRYCSSYLNFLKQKDELISSQTRRSPRAQNSHLAFINLLEAVSQLKVIQREFRKLFSELVNEEGLDSIDNRETNNITLLLEVWKFLEETNLQKIDSVALVRKKLIAQKKKNVEWFFTQKLLELSGVLFVSSPIVQSDGDGNIYVVVDIENTETFFHTLYEEFKSAFSDAATLTIDSLYVQNFVDNIIVIPAFNSLPMTGAIKVETRNLMSFDEEKFIRYRAPYEYDNYMKDNYTTILPTDEIFSRWSLLLALSSAIGVLLSHVNKTNLAIGPLPKSTVNKDVLAQWHQDGVASVSEIVTRFTMELQLLSEDLHADPGAKDYLDLAKRNLDALQSNMELLIKGVKQEKIVNRLQELTSCLENLYPYVIQARN